MLSVLLPERQFGQALKTDEEILPKLRRINFQHTEYGPNQVVVLCDIVYKFPCAEQMFTESLTVSFEQHDYTTYFVY